MSIDSKQYVKNVNKVKGCLKKLKDGGVVATAPLKMHLPQRLEEKGAVKITDTVTVVASYALIAEDKYYAMDNGTVPFQTEPTEINRIEVDGLPYIELVYEADDRVQSRPWGLKDKQMVAPINGEFMGNGNIPWYFEPSDLVSLSLNFERYNSVNLKTDMAIYEIIVSLMMRSPKDANVPYRDFVKSQEGFTNNPPEIVGVNQVDLIVNGTMAKLGGPYLNGSITGALNVQSESVSEIEYIQRV